MDHILLFETLFIQGCSVYAFSLVMCVFVPWNPSIYCSDTYCWESWSATGSVPVKLGQQAVRDSTSRCFCGSGQRQLMDSGFFALLLALSARKVNTRYRQLTWPVAGGTEPGPWGSAKTKALVCWATVLATVQQFQTTDYLIACLDFSNDFTYLFDDLYPSLCFWQVPLWTKSRWAIAYEYFTVNHTLIFGTYVHLTLCLVVHKICV